MVRVKTTETSFTERCQFCMHEHTIQRSLTFRKVRRNDAQGVRDDNMSKHWRDALQPIGPDGRENKVFTKTYGYNPSAEDPRVKKDRQDNPHSA